MAKDRAAFKAELGANFNNKGFIAYQRQVASAEKETGKLRTTQDKTKVSTDKVGGSALGAAGKFGKLAGAAIAVGAAYEGIAKAKDAIESTLTLGEATERLTAATSLDTKQASTWIETAKARNISSTQVTRGFSTLDKQIRSASQGSKTSKKAFDELGVSQKALASGNTAKILDDVAQGLKNQKDPADRAALAQQLFGRAAQGLLPVFKEGKKGVEDALGATQKYGDFLSNKGTKSFKGALEAQRGLGQASQGLKIAFTEAVLPTLVKVAGGVLDFVKQMRSGKGAGGEFATVMKGAFGVVKTAVGAVVTAIDFLIKHWPQIRAAAEPVVKWLIGAVTDVVGFFVRNWPQIKASAKAVFDWLVTAAQNVGHWLVNAFNTVEPRAVAVFNAIKGVVGPVITAIVNGFKNLVPTVAPFLSAFGGAVSTAFQVIKAIVTPIVQVVIPLIVTAFKTAWSETKVILGALAGVVRGAFQVVKGVIEFFTGLFSLNFSTMWKGIKDIFSGAIKELIAILKGALGLLEAAGKGLITAIGQGISGAWTLLKKAFGVGLDALVGLVTGIGGDLFDAGKAIIGQLGDGFTWAFNGVWGIIKGFINDVIDAIDLIPGVNIHHVGGSGPGATSSKAVSNLQKAGFATGGMVNQPGYFAGEEAPQHPEVILATNPAYRQRNLGLLGAGREHARRPRLRLGRDPRHRRARHHQRRQHDRLARVGSGVDGHRAAVEPAEPAVAAVVDLRSARRAARQGDRIHQEDGRQPVLGRQRHHRPGRHDDRRRRPGPRAVRRAAGRVVDHPRARLRPKARVERRHHLGLPRRLRSTRPERFRACADQLPRRRRGLRRHGRPRRPRQQTRVHGRHQGLHRPAPAARLRVPRRRAHERHRALPGRHPRPRRPRAQPRHPRLCRRRRQLPGEGLDVRAAQRGRRHHRLRPLEQRRRDLAAHPRHRLG